MVPLAIIMISPAGVTLSIPLSPPRLLRFGLHPGSGCDTFHRCWVSVTVFPLVLWPDFRSGQATNKAEWTGLVILIWQSEWKVEHCHCHHPMGPWSLWHRCHCQWCCDGCLVWLLTDQSSLSSQYSHYRGPGDDKKCQRAPCLGSNVCLSLGVDVIILSSQPVSPSTLTLISPSVLPGSLPVREPEVGDKGNKYQTQKEMWYHGMCVIAASRKLQSPCQ